MNSGQFRKLFESKFGTERGSQLRGANALNMRQGNLSAYLRGTGGTPPQKYTDALRALPDYQTPSGITHELADGVNQLITYFTAKLTPQAAKDLEFAARFHTAPSCHMPDLTADEDATARLMELLLESYRELIDLDHAGIAARIRRTIKKELEEDRKQLNLELADRKHLVADELTENEVLADEDPLA